MLFNWQDDGGIEIVFYADYINYRGVHYVDSTVTFSRSSVIVKSNTINGNTGTFHIQLEIEDIIKIESQWAARVSFFFLLFCMYVFQCFYMNETKINCMTYNIYSV